jgi:hypothetical protein
MVRYKIKPEHIEENKRLVGTLIEELRAEKPDTIRYLALQLDDGTFVHLSFVEDGASGVGDLKAFEGYHEKLYERRAEEPIVCDATIVGDYRFMRA